MIYWILFIGIALVSYLVQAQLNAKFEKYAKVPNEAGLTGREVAEKMLRENGIYDVKVTSLAEGCYDAFLAIEHRIVGCCGG